MVPIYFLKAVLPVTSQNRPGKWVAMINNMETSAADSVRYLLR